ncbi:hypothetical protein [Methanobacterium oryzae]|uniref:hypothetical protein n=1 Tax=Methanobacterium oryzae TaxID=69540 RepID=UPI003D1DB8BF
MIVEKAINTIKKMKGVVDVRKLQNEDKEVLKCSEFSKKEDIIPVINTGLEECLKREYLLLLLKNRDFRRAPNPTVLLITDKGRVLGQELISPEEKEEYQCRDDVYFLSNDFVMFKIDKNAIRTVGEKQLFVLPSIPFPELDSIENIVGVVSCSPSTIGDYYLKNRYGYPDDPNLATILVGFSKAK